MLPDGVTNSEWCGGVKNPNTDWDSTVRQANPRTLYFNQGVMKQKLTERAKNSSGDKTAQMKQRNKDLEKSRGNPY